MTTNNSSEPNHETTTRQQGEREVRTAEDIHAATARELLGTFVPADVHDLLLYWQYEESEDQYGFRHPLDALGGVLWLGLDGGELTTYDESENAFYAGSEAEGFVADTVAALRKLC